MQHKTLYDKIWERHLVVPETDAPAIIYVDLHLIHEVTSPQAFDELRKRGLRLRRTDLTLGGWRIAVLYGINTAGAALGAVVTDFSLVPAAGLWGAQMVGVGCNLLAGAGAWYLARASQSVLPKPVTAASKEHRKAARSRRVRVQPETTGADQAAIVAMTDQVIEFQCRDLPIDRLPL